jgi:hypothetical protein
MDDTAFLHGRIESYAGYTNDVDRQRSDEQVRAYVGEALTGVRARLSPGGTASEALERLLLRCEFANQAVARAFDASDVPAAEIAATAAADRELVALADRSREVDAAGLDSFLAQIDAAFNRRWRDAADSAQPSAEPPAR